jgi:hypothetical protein
MNRINLSHHFGAFRSTYKTGRKALASASSIHDQTPESR